MRRLRSILFRLRGVFSRARRDADLAAEIQCHLQLHVDDNLRGGMTAAEARRDALVKLGGVEPVKERYREQRGVPVVEPGEGSALRRARAAESSHLHGDGRRHSRPWVSARTPPSTPSSIACCCGRCPTPIRTGSRRPRATSSQKPRRERFVLAQWPDLVRRCGRMPRLIDVAASSGGVSGVNLVAGGQAAFVQQQRVYGRLFPRARRVARAAGANSPSTRIA